MRASFFSYSGLSFLFPRSVSSNYPSSSSSSSWFFCPSTPLSTSLNPLVCSIRSCIKLTGRILLRCDSRSEQSLSPLSPNHSLALFFFFKFHHGSLFTLSFPFLRPLFLIHSPLRYASPLTRLLRDSFHPFSPTLI